MLSNMAMPWSRLEQIVRSGLVPAAELDVLELDTCPQFDTSISDSSRLRDCLGKARFGSLQVTGRMKRDSEVAEELTCRSVICRQEECRRPRQ